ncbi:hypothetical protein V6N13_054530 [Hibiscus sabdariffa]|uniref:Uncharacterized protein n=1 Tax=Hibiscus sabdariffa TaxID=183260 RepID=A0ABR2DZ80_9ROSI
MAMEVTIQVKGRKMLSSPMAIIRPDSCFLIFSEIETVLMEYDPTVGLNQDILLLLMQKLQAEEINEEHHSGW